MGYLIPVCTTFPERTKISCDQNDFFPGLNGPDIMDDSSTITYQFSGDIDLSGLVDSVIAEIGTENNRDQTWDADIQKIQCQMKNVGSKH